MKSNRGAFPAIALAVALFSCCAGNKEPVAADPTGAANPATAERTILSVSTFAIKGAADNDIYFERMVATGAVSRSCAPLRFTRTGGKVDYASDARYAILSADFKPAREEDGFSVIAIEASVDAPKLPAALARAVVRFALAELRSASAYRDDPAMYAIGQALSKTREASGSVWIEAMGFDGTTFSVTVARGR